MTVKYKVSDFAKDLNVSAKKVLDELAAMGSTGKKNSSTLEENELNYLLEKFSKDNSVASRDEYLKMCIRDRIKAAIVIAVKKNYEVEDDNVLVEIDPDSGKFNVALAVSYTHLRSSSP